MSNHKRDKKRRRARQLRKESNTHSGSFRSRYPQLTAALSHPKPMDKESVLAQAKPIEESKQVE